MIIFYICLFFFGASLASFINATIYRIENKYPLKEFLSKPSHCEKCNKELTWYELFPIFGYILCQGKCPNCKTKINPYYPISELFLGLSFLLFYVYSVPWYSWVPLFSFFILSGYDIKDHSVPARFVDVFLVICVLIWIIFIRDLSILIVPVSMFVFFNLLNLIKKFIGYGDLLMLVATGILMYPGTYMSFFWIGILLALLYSIFLILFKKADIKTAKVPMIPFFGMSFVIAVVYGEQLYEILLNYIGI